MRLCCLSLRRSLFRRCSSLDGLLCLGSRTGLNLIRSRVLDVQANSKCPYTCGFSQEALGFQFVFRSCLCHLDFSQNLANIFRSINSHAAGKFLGARSSLVHQRVRCTARSCFELLCISASASSFARSLVEPELDLDFNGRDPLLDVGPDSFCFRKRQLCPLQFVIRFCPRIDAVVFCSGYCFRFSLGSYYLGLRKSF